MFLENIKIKIIAGFGISIFEYRYTDITEIVNNMIILKLFSVIFRIPKY